MLRQQGGQREPARAEAGQREQARRGEMTCYRQVIWGDRPQRRAARQRYVGHSRGQIGQDGGDQGQVPLMILWTYV